MGQLFAARSNPATYTNLAFLSSLMYSYRVDLANPVDSWRSLTLDAPE